MHSFTRAFDFWKVYSLLMYPCFVISLVLRMVMSYNDKCEDVPYVRALKKSINS